MHADCLVKRVLFTNTVAGFFVTYLPLKMNSTFPADVTCSYSNRSFFAALMIILIVMSST